VAGRLQSVQRASKTAVLAADVGTSSQFSYRICEVSFAFHCLAMIGQSGQIPRNP
jgi:hypothetical protein